MLAVKEALEYAQSKNWTIVSSYCVKEFKPVNKKFAAAVKWDAKNMANVIQLSLKNVDIPQHSGDLVEKILAGEWHFTRNDDEIYVITFTFRDMGGGSLYRIFKNIWRGSRVNYPDDYAFSCNICLVDPRVKSGESYAQSEYSIFQTEKMYITSISQLQLSHDTNEVLEFSVEFKTNEPAFDNTKFDISFDGNPTVNTTKDGTYGSVSNLVNRAVNKATNAVRDFTQTTVKEWAEGVGKDIKHRWDS